MFVIIAAVIERSATDPTSIRFLPSVYSQVVAEDGLEGEDFGAEGAGMGPAYSAQRRNPLQEREGRGHSQQPYGTCFEVPLVRLIKYFIYVMPIWVLPLAFAGFKG